MSDMTERELKALQIAAKAKLQRSGDRWFVPSQTKGKGGAYYYTVKPDPIHPHCTCPDFESRKLRCKHIFAVEYTIEREQTSDGETVVTETLRISQKTYSQDWPSYNKAQTHEKEHFQKLLRELCKGIGESSQTIGRPRMPLDDMIFSAAFKVYSTVSARRFMCDLRDARAKGYILRVPAYNTIFKYFENDLLTPHLQMLIEESALPLQTVESAFAVDSSGFSTSRFFQWVDAKYTNPELVTKRDWVKVHLMCGVKTNVVTAVEITDRFANDCPQFKELVEATGRNFTMAEVSADKGYLSSDNLQTVVDHNAMPYIPFKSNSVSSSRRGNPGTALWKQMFHFYSFNQDRFMQCYHKRSNV
jgi:predicted nucleic acid-binding Zn finger protein